MVIYRFHHPLEPLFEISNGMRKDNPKKPLLFGSKDRPIRNEHLLLYQSPANLRV